MGLSQAYQFSEMDRHNLGWQEADSEGAEKQANIFTTETNHRENPFPLWFVSVSPHTMSHTI